MTTAMDYQYLQWLPLAVTFVILLIVFAMKFYFRVDLPDDFPEEDEKAMISFLRTKKFSKLITSVAHKLGLAERTKMLRTMNKLLAESADDDEPSIKVTQITLGGVSAKLYRPGDDKNVDRGVVYIHGEGWAPGNADEIDHVTTQIAKAGFLVVSIQYRLAPEYPFPVPFEDCVKATKAFISEAETLKINPAKIAIAGSSSGGNLAAAVALKLRDENVTPGVKAQVLLYPCLQAFDFNTSSYERNQHDLVLDKELMTSMWLYYAVGHNKDVRDAMVNGHVSQKLKRDTKLMNYTDTNKLPLKYKGIKRENKNSNTDANGSEKLWEMYEPIVTNHYFAPLMADDLSGLPPTYLGTCEYDVLRDDGLLFLSRLKSADVKVIHQHYSKAFHAPLDVSDMAYGKKILTDVCQYLDKHV